MTSIAIVAAAARGSPAPPARGRLRQLSSTLYRHPRARLGLLLAAPLGWLVIAYLGSLALFLISSFWSVDSLSGKIVTTPTLDNYVEILTTPVYRTIARPDRRDGGARDPDDDPRRVPDRLLHGEAGVAPRRAAS